MILAHDVIGAGPAVLLLHSTVCDRRMWDPQVPVLSAAGHRVVRCDLRGYGETPVPDRPYDNAGDVAALLDSLGVRSAAVIGASGGGRVALQFSARWPSRVTALALLCTAVDGLSVPDFDAREEELFEAGDLDGATRLNVDTWVGPAASPQTRAFVSAMQRHTFEIQAAADSDPPPVRAPYDLADITAPTLIVSGAHDRVEFRQAAAELAGQLRSARHIELDWAGHLPSLERPDLTNPILLDFLSIHHPHPPPRVVP
jgi:pimeloyl-ACP methyl ester carboxylesterase